MIRELTLGRNAGDGPHRVRTAGGLARTGGDRELGAERSGEDLHVPQGEAGGDDGREKELEGAPLD